MSQVIWATEVAELRTNIRRVADGLRTLSEGRLAAGVPGHGSRAAEARALAQRLADVAVGVEAAYGDAVPRWREVPDLGDLTVGDQVAVTGQDAVAAFAAAEPSRPAWTREGRSDAAALLSAARTAVSELRQRL